MCCSVKNAPATGFTSQTQDAIYEKRVLNFQHQRAYDFPSLGLTFAKQDKRAAKADSDPRSKANQYGEAGLDVQNFFATSPLARS